MGAENNIANIVNHRKFFRSTTTLVFRVASILNTGPRNKSGLAFGVSGRPVVSGIVFFRKNDCVSEIAVTLRNRRKISKLILACTDWH